MKIKICLIVRTMMEIDLELKSLNFLITNCFMLIFLAPKKLVLFIMMMIIIIQMVVSKFCLKTFTIWGNGVLLKPPLTRPCTTTIIVILKFYILQSINLFLFFIFIMTNRVWFKWTLKLKCSFLYYLYINYY